VRARLGTPCSRVWFNSRMRPCQGRDDGATPFTRSIIGGVAHKQSARLTCERQRGQQSSLPPFLSLWCSPANTPSSQAGDHRSEAGRGRQLQFALKALSAMHSLGKRISPVQFRVRDPVLMAVRQHRSRASAQVGFISPPRPGQHRRLLPFCLHAAACGLLL
jgi:hypothetical protein